MPKNTKNKILSSTLSLIDKKPFPQVSTREIAKKTGISEGAIFKHYQSKDEILTKLTDKFFTIITDLDLSQVEDEKDFKEKLVIFFSNSHKVNLIKRQIFKFVLYICMYKPKRFIYFNEIINNKLMLQVENTILKGQKEWGYKKNIDIKINVRLLMYSIGFFTIQQNVFRADKIDKYDMEKVIRIAIDNFLNSLK
jgi:DNA-binding transcriptional regulator YhcF (GntR family)